MFRRTAIVVVLVCITWLLYSLLREGRNEVVITGPVLHERMAPAVQNINLLEPPAGFEPLVWKPGDPFFDPGDLRFEETNSFARESWFRRWLRRWCCALFSCKPEPPVQPPDKPDEPTTIKIGVDAKGIQGTTLSAPDPVGDIGPGHYVQAVNSAFQVFGRTGNPIMPSPELINVLWDETSGVTESHCKQEPPVDPVVRYDQAADRWLISGFVSQNFNGESYMCIAVSKTGDPVNGGWNAYEFRAAELSGALFSLDSPKLSVWPDAYYLSTFRGIGKGIDVWALEREKMLQGQSAALVRFHLPALDVILLPGDLDGTPPPPGTPGLFARQVDGERVGGGGDRIEVFALTVDWAAPGNATFVLEKSLPVEPFDSRICTTDAYLDSDSLLDYCVPQPDVQPYAPQKLETLGLWPQWRLQYRNMGGHESMLFNHTIKAAAAGHAGVRWYELRRLPGADWTIGQQGTHQDQDLGFFMGGISMDGKGDVALGYAASSTTVFPGIRIAHRMAGDAPGSLPGTEYLAVAGNGSQLAPNGRWGNYSTMDVDPVDDCTFWYTHEYYETSSQAGWLTRIISFKLPGCD